MSEDTTYDVEAIRREFPLLDREVNGFPLVFLDSAASAQKPIVVIESQREYLSHFHSNIHRGVHALATQATEAFEGAREIIRAHFNATSTSEIIFTSGATDSINLVAGTWGRANLKQNSTVVLTRMEHHSNIVPWQILSDEIGFKIEVVELLSDGSLDMSQFRDKMALSPDLVCFTHVSNTLGTINDVKNLTSLAKAAGAIVLIDGAQSAPHIKVDLLDIGCDFFVASGHKMYGPTGIGFLYGKLDLLESMPPWKGGGEMISSVSFEERTTFNVPPYKFEAGTPHISGAIAFGAAINWLNKVGMEAITMHEHALTRYAHTELLKTPGLKIYGNAKEKAGVVSFLVEGTHPSDLGTLLDQLGIAVRTGHHCTEPLMTKLGIPGTVRASFAAYTTFAEIDVLTAGISRAVKMLN
ncbi:MAG TPA: SufS family cysteine desulfurase [Flavobacteriales bacterium]|nr:SufS family cysteine desulfurase [Flavobacteriales bacterium]HIB76613.1 SufS family cysteine desulfurase [Flavobacteriales bacterium]HIO16687.1 SufS family cysteine desulfurase [Flavobacteriales bacterium]